jgi:hypothetical protein
MAKAEYDAGIKGIIDEMLLPVPGVKPGKMFGYPGYYINGKLFACVYENGVSLKVPVGVREELLAEADIEFFVPMENRPMREWVFIRKGNPKDYRDYEKAFLAGLEYVAGQAKKG